MSRRAVVFSLIVVNGFLNARSSFSILRALAMITLVGFLNLGCSHFKNDSAPEEFIEDVIQDFTGLDVDLTSTDGQ